ncbi:MAG TPA: glycosyltransferase [Steroidobacteraceae bacterium]|jgi:glycosyltransferase involved in cell wall biosynthesis|nr:glycosyltransferase [Steroidobacteraceae bacterium]
MRILKIVPQAFYAPRGTPLSAYHRARELAAQGHQVDILTYGIGEPPPGLDARLFRARGPHFCRTLRAGPSGRKIWLDALLFASLIGRLCREHYDALYAHEEAALLARIAGALFGIPYVYDMHSSLPLQITDWKFSQRRSVVALFRWIERICVRGACAVVAISPAVARAARSAWPDALCVVLTNYFELEQAAGSAEREAIRSRHGVRPQEKLIVYTGSFVALQALDLLLEAFPGVLARVPEARLLLVGGSEPEIAQLRARAERLGIAERVILECARPQADIPGYLAAADALVSPRVQGINPPGKLLSYLASGRPVVATDTLVHNQLLTGECAILTRPDAAGLADGLVLALTDAALAARLKDAGGRVLARLCSKSAREAAYDEIVSAVRAAGALPRKHPARLLASRHSPPHRR